MNSLSSSNMKKSFERLLWNNVLSFSIEYNLVPQTQSDEVKLGNSRINHNLGTLYSGSFWGGGGGGITTPAYLKLVKIMLEIWSLVRRYIHIYNFRKFSFYYQSSLNFVDISIFLQKISIYFYSKVVELR